MEGARSEALLGQVCQPLILGVGEAVALHRLPVTCSTLWDRNGVSQLLISEPLVAAWHLRLLQPSPTRKPLGEVGNRTEHEALPNGPSLEQALLRELQQVGPCRLVDNPVTRLM